MKKIILGLLAAMCCVVSYAQRSTVTATIPSYAGGTVSATFLPQGGGKPSVVTAGGNIDGNGTFSLNVWQNTYSAYFPSLTQLTICAANTPATCYTAQVQITSSSQNVSSSFTSAPSPSSVPGGAANQILVQTAPNSTGFIATCNTGVISTNSSGVPMCSTAIPSNTAGWSVVADATGVGTGGSVACDTGSGYTCTSRYGAVKVIVGTSPRGFGGLFTLTLGTTQAYPTVCVYNAVIYGSASNANSVFQGGSTTTTSIAWMAINASTNYDVFYVCP